MVGSFKCSTESSGIKFEKQPEIWHLGSCHDFNKISVRRGMEMESSCSGLENWKCSRHCI